MEGASSLCLVGSFLVSLVCVAVYIVYTELYPNIVVITGKPPISKITFAYKFKQGSYKECVHLLKESHILAPKLSCLGVYYDDPNKVPGPECRYAIGCILSEGEKKADTELLVRCEQSGFNVCSFPEVTHVVTTSLTCGRVFSVLLRVKRVYLQLALFIKERRLCAHPFLEIYREGFIQFMVPLARQGDFYVPEVRQAQRRLSEDSQSDSTISGEDSNSEYSSGSGILLSDSRESSLLRSPSAHSWEESDHRGSSAGGSLCKEAAWVDAESHQKETPAKPNEDSIQKHFEVPHQNILGSVADEE
ncbi:testis-expressed protein 264 homolog [Synchiropus splendidus]|uniref:testis-expressed protein 264 homolog n=1 Tax=Synchiropus splendidus TaxID=270530 RepID=UPI00237D7608|nr:testis-expressed protein 264 homolog [Synchiropus splendidus]